MRNVLKLSDAQAERLYQRLYAFWQEYEAIAKEPADVGQFYAFAVALYPNAGAGFAAAGTARNRRKRSAK